MVLLRVKLARRLQTILVSGGCAAFSIGLGIQLGTGAGLMAAGVLSAAYGLLLVDDGGQA